MVATMTTAAPNREDRAGGPPFRYSRNRLYSTPFNTNLARLLTVKIPNFGWAGGPPFRDPRNRLYSTLFNTNLARLLTAKILNFGCPVLDALQGRGFCFDLPRVEGQTKEPRPTKLVERGTLNSNSKAGPPALHS